MIFVSKNWPNDLKVGCKSPSNLVEFIEVNWDLEKGLEQFEGDFKRDEVSELKICEMTTFATMLILFLKIKLIFF